MTKTTGSDGTGCSRFGPLFPGSGYSVSEVRLLGYLHIGTVVAPASSRDAGYGSNPSPSNPVNVTLTFSQAQNGTGPRVTFVNFLTVPSLDQSCDVAILDGNGNVPARSYAIAGDTVTFTYTVANTGNIALNVVQVHTNVARLGPNPIFLGILESDVTHTETRSFTVL